VRRAIASVRVAWRLGSVPPHAALARPSDGAAVGSTAEAAASLVPHHCCARVFLAMRIGCGGRARMLGVLTGVPRVLTMGPPCTHARVRRVHADGGCRCVASQAWRRLQRRRRAGTRARAALRGGKRQLAQRAYAHGGPRAARASRGGCGTISETAPIALQRRRTEQPSTPVACHQPARSRASCGRRGAFHAAHGTARTMLARGVLRGWVRGWVVGWVGRSVAARMRRRHTRSRCARSMQRRSSRCARTAAAARPALAQANGSTAIGGLHHAD